jgi:Glycosyl transferase family 2
MLEHAKILPFFFGHYDPLVDAYTVFDDGSTDGSLEILRANPKVEVRRFARPIRIRLFFLSCIFPTGAGRKAEARPTG